MYVICLNKRRIIKAWRAFATVATSVAVLSCYLSVALFCLWLVFFSTFCLKRIDQLSARSVVCRERVVAGFGETCFSFQIFYIEIFLSMIFGNMMSWMLWTCFGLFVKMFSFLWARFAWGVWCDFNTEFTLCSNGCLSYNNLHRRRLWGAARARTPNN